MAALAFSLVSSWSGLAAADGPSKPHDPRGDPNGMTLGGVAAVMLALPALSTGAVLYADTGGWMPGRALSPFFLVPGGASAAAGVALIAVGLARGNGDGDDAASSRAIRVVVAPRQVGLRGAF